MVFEQNNRLLINKDLWIKCCIAMTNVKKDAILSMIKKCEKIIWFILKNKEHWANKGQSTFFWIYPFLLIKA
jgi:predicted DNA-binding protein YlxM (UPF0122 family)